MPDETGIDGTPWPFREAFMTRRMVMIWELAPELADALEHRSWGDPPTSAVCIPITDDWENGRLSFLIVGLNTRRPYDADYEEFIVDLQYGPRASSGPGASSVADPLLPGPPTGPSSSPTSRASRCSRARPSG